MAHFRAERYLAESVASVLGQTLLDLELLVIDDGSADDAWMAQLAPFASDPRLRVFRSPQNVGNYLIKSQAIYLCDSRYLAFQDADDVSYANRLDRQIAAISQERTEILGTGFKYIDPSGKKLGTRIMPRNARRSLHLGKSFSMLHPTTVMPISVFRELGGFDQSLRIVGDHDFFLRASLRFRMRNLSEVLYGYRVHEAALTQRPDTGHGSQQRLQVTKDVWRRHRRRLLHWPFAGGQIAAAEPRRISLESIALSFTPDH